MREREGSRERELPSNVQQRSNPKWNTEIDTQNEQQLKKCVKR